MKLVPALSLFSLVPIALVGCTAPASPRADGGTALVLADGYELGNYNPVAASARRARPRCTTGGPALRGPGLRYPRARARARSRDAGSRRRREGVDRPDPRRRPIHGRHDVRTRGRRRHLPRDSRSRVGVAAGHVVRHARVSAGHRPRHRGVPARLSVLAVAHQAAARDRTVRTADRGLAEQSPLNSAPVGTGPYELVSLRADQAVYEANEDYWDGAPQVKRLTVVYVPDDNARASGWRRRTRRGQPSPLLANTFADRNGYEVVATRPRTGAA